MQCREVRDLADSFLSEQLLVETNHQVLRHLEGCPACRAELESRRELRAAIRRTFIHNESLRISDEFRSRAVSRLRTAIPGKHARMNSRRWMIGLTVAAVLILVAGVGEFLHTRGISLIVRDALADHENCAIQFRLPEKPVPLEEAAARYDPSFRLLEDTPSNDWNTPVGPLRIIDRHSCVFQGRRFAHIVLQIQGQVVSLLITANEAGVKEARQDGGGLPRLAELPSEDGFQVVSFDVPGHTVLLVGSLGEQELRQVAQSLSVPLYSRFARG
jgi:putative zinc finger protein